MTRPVTVRARFEPTAGECYEAEITMHAPFPVAVDEARKQVQRMMDHMIDHALERFPAEKND